METYDMEYQHKNNVCPSDCMNNGICTAVQASDGGLYYNENNQLVELCSISQIDCQMICECHEGYEGKDCSKKSQTHVNKIKIRDEIIQFERL